MKTKDPRKNAMLNKAAAQAVAVSTVEQKASKPSKKLAAFEDDTKSVKSNNKLGTADATIDTTEIKTKQQQHTFAEDQLDM